MYVFFAVKNGARIPFYVGESGRGIARIADYINAQFAAPTDFKVGTTARLLEKRGYEIFVEIENSEDRKKGEKRKIEELSEWPLLNFIAGYDYKRGDRTEVTALLQRYVDENFST